MLPSPWPPVQLLARLSCCICLLVGISVIRRKLKQVREVCGWIEATSLGSLPSPPGNPIPLSSTASPSQAFVYPSGSDSQSWLKSSSS